jgi:hypothetical protein
MSGAEWSETSRAAGNVTFTACSRDGQPIAWTLEGVRVPFEPSVFGGDGSETRVNICFADVSEEIKAQLTAMEQSIHATTSCIKGECLKCKISRDKVRTYDASKTRCDLPETLRGWTVNARVHLRGKWATRQGCGLSLEVTDLQVKCQQTHTLCPF